MADTFNKYIIYTADDEEPNCVCCDLFGSKYECEKWCGPKYGWDGYRRTDEVDL